MNPNSAHQMWSLWTFRVKPGRTSVYSVGDLKHNLGKFSRKVFGSASQMKIEVQNGLVFMVRTEGHPVHDAQYVEYVRKLWNDFLTVGFGVGTEVTLEAKLEAGSRQDGSPSEQLIILPPVRVDGA